MKAKDQVAPSAGSILGAAIQRVAAEGLLIKGGGHKMAAGLTVARAQLEPAMARLSELLGKQGAGELGPSDLRTRRCLDAKCRDTRVDRTA